MLDRPDASTFCIVIITHLPKSSVERINSCLASPRSRDHCMRFPNDDVMCSVWKNGTDHVITLRPAMPHQELCHLRGNNKALKAVHFPTGTTINFWNLENCKCLCNPGSAIIQCIGSACYIKSLNIMCTWCIALVGLEYTSVHEMTYFKTANIFQLYIH